MSIGLMVEWLEDVKICQGAGEQQGEHRTVCEGLEASKLLECVETPFLLNVTGYH